MKKYRVLKSYPKQITNSGRLITLKPNKSVYLKDEPQVVRLVRLGFIASVKELPVRKPKVKVAKKVDIKSRGYSKPYRYGVASRCSYS